MTHLSAEVGLDLEVVERDAHLCEQVRLQKASLRVQRERCRRVVQHQTGGQTNRVSDRGGRTKPGNNSAAIGECHKRTTRHMARCDYVYLLRLDMRYIVETSSPLITGLKLEHPHCLDSVKFILFESKTSVTRHSPLNFHSYLCLLYDIQDNNIQTTRAPV